jgi:hypothetical protein
MAKVRFPTIPEVARELRALNDEARDELDVRLQVTDDGDWRVHFGDPGYDQDHRGYWGAGSVPGRGRRFDSTGEARRLINEARDQQYAEEAYGGQRGVRRSASGRTRSAGQCRNTRGRFTRCR